MSFLDKIFGKKKSEDDKAKKRASEEFIICPHCYVDYTVKQIQESGGACPSCKGEIDLDKIPRAQL